MMDFIKKLFPKNPKKKPQSYTAQVPDWTEAGYWVLIGCFGVYFIFTLAGGAKIGLGILMGIPALIGVFVILFVLPLRFLTFILTQAVVNVYLLKIPKDIPAKTAVVIGYEDKSRPSYWVAPNYDMDLIILLEHLKIKGEPFAVYRNATLEKLDAVMANENIRTVYLVGHGRRHGFGIEPKITVDYCRYADKKYQKDFIYQIHCNHGGGTSLVEYVVPQANQKECLPEHGYMSNMTINQMFIDKITSQYRDKPIVEFAAKTGYSLLAISITASVFIIWGIAFVNLFKMVA